MSNINKKNYCPLIYKGLYIEKVNGTEANIGSCCISRQQKFDTLDFVNNPHLVSQRERIRNGINIEECDECWNREKQSGFSIRVNTNMWYDAKGLLDDPYKTELTTIEYNTEPVCNARCIICGPWYSSMWAAEEGTGRIVSETRQNTFLENVDLSKLRRIYFNGGEPLLTKDHLQVLESIPDLSQVDIWYNTNGSIWPNDKTIELWSRANNVIVNFSIDSIGESFEYIRNPLAWDTVADNFKRMLTLDPRVKVGLSYSAGLHNLLNIYETRQWWESAITVNPDAADGFFVHPTHGYLDVTHAYPALKAQFISYLDGDESEWAQMLVKKMLDSLLTYDNRWLERLGELDQRRGLDWRLSLPNLAEAHKKIEGGTSH